MIGKIPDSLSVQAEALKLRSTRQETLAANLVNAETPGYRAVDFDFASALASRLKEVSSGATMNAATNAAAAPRTFERTSYQPALDGNTVDADAERARFADNALRYEAALRTLNHEIKQLLSAIQG